MTYEESSEKVRQALAKFSNTNSEDWFLCLKARFGMAEIFYALHDIEPNAEIITCPYTCITAINPILVAGLKPIYADITPDYLSIYAPDDVLVGKKTAAIVMQHTLGIIKNKQKIANFAKKHQILLIEDSAHCLTRFARDKENNIISDISIHSFGVEKILTTTKFGGAIYVNPLLREKNPELYKNITTRLKNLPKPDRSMNFRMRTYRYNNAVLQRLPSGIKQNLRNFEIKTGILEPAIYPFEQEAKQDQSQTTNSYINERILSQIETLKSNFIRREANVNLYQKHLKSKKFEKIITKTEPLLAYPIIFSTTTQANQAYAMLSSESYFIRRWYSPLLYPGPKNIKDYFYNPKKCPIAEKICQKTLCLPTDLPIIETQKIIKLLND